MPMGCLYAHNTHESACVVLYIHGVGFCIAYSELKVIPTTSTSG